MQADVELRNAIEPFIEEGWIEDVLYEVKSGKEATVFCCRGGPRAAAELIRRATVVPKKRVRTRVSLSQKRKRVEAKKRRGEVKALRGSVGED